MLILVMAQSILSLPITSVPAHLLGISHVFFTTLQELHCGIKFMYKNYAPPMRQTKDEVLLREAASHISVRHTHDLKWGPLKVYS